MNTVSKVISDLVAKPRLRRLARLRAVVTAMAIWEKSWSTDRQCLPPTAGDILPNSALLGELARCADLLAVVRKRVFERLRLREEWPAAYNLYREQYMQWHDARAYERLWAYRTAERLREEVEALSSRIDSLHPEAAEQ